MVRDFKDPKWINLRRRVFHRDGYKCKWCGAKSEMGRYGKHLNAHHIKTWASAPLLRFDINNLITLCWQCHQKVWGKETEYEAFFKKLLMRDEKKHNMENLLWLLENKYKKTDDSQS